MADGVAAGSPTVDGRRQPTALVVVVIAGQRYAFALRDVVEVQRAVAVRPLPASPEVVEGVIDLRGEFMPVVVIRVRFGLAPRAESPDQQLAIVRAGARVVAVRVDATLGVRNVELDDLDTTALDVPGVHHLVGVGRDEEGIVLVHDLAALLSWREEEELDDALRHNGLGDGGRVAT